jgi:hypothetical protein
MRASRLFAVAAIPILWLATTASASAIQQPSQEVLAKQRAEKLAKPVFENASWHTDYDEARAEAAKTGKLILTYPETCTKLSPTVLMLSSACGATRSPFSSRSAFSM